MPKFTPQQLDELYHQTLAEFAASPENGRAFSTQQHDCTSMISNRRY